MRLVQDARVALLSRLIDHAPLFPPAEMALPDALEEDRRARESRSAFVLARFVCPASRLAGLPDVGHGLSVVLDAPLDVDGRVEAVEARAHEDLASAAGVVSEVYVEVPLDDAVEERLDALAARGLRAKVRCGGAAVPSVAKLSRFVRGCGDRDLVFKATAGLHHAIRRDGEHGFLNLLAAAVFGDEEEALAESDPEAFIVDRDGFAWRGRVATVDELRRSRSERLHSIGSCSFFEPVEELEALGVLPL